MSNYLDLKAQAEEILRQAEKARQEELEFVLQEIRARVVEYGLTAEQVFGRQRSLKRRESATFVSPKYQDPKTGATWSGRGREPSWIKGKRRDRFLIQPELQ
ncbi:H-NS histone family protein [Burkholderia cenocepacia]|uniref:H-NS histone family protein n=1 Tax=Burkholderia cenocepacia TaxID=95486 RepID=UPI000F599D24|nr:H-NS histone family protein [Burkholderia cenocepacia]RQU49449.1 H-NS histone family protein [Burkholderia cenocepacia]RQV33860.1 H-NS histone family protein [Burkholderia cenocepacia]